MNTQLPLVNFTYVEMVQLLLSFTRATPPWLHLPYATLATYNWIKYCCFLTVYLPNVTGSAKTGLIAHENSVEFSPWTQWYMNAQLSFKTSYTNKVVCFCWLLFCGTVEIVWSVWGPNGSLASQRMAVSDCKPLWCWIKMSVVNFPSF